MQRFMCLVVTSVLSAIAAPVPAQASRSTALAAELSDLLAQRGLDAVAAVDPQGPDRFVAALLFPKVQLLVVSAKYPAPALAQQQIASKAYRDVYMGLQQAGATEGKIFFQDLGADGLSDAAVDILYEDVVKQTVFDGDPEKHNMTKAAYQQKVADADASYSRLLSLLINELKAPKAP